MTFRYKSDFVLRFIIPQRMNSAEQKLFLLRPNKVLCECDVRVAPRTSSNRLKKTGTRGVLAWPLTLSAVNSLNTRAVRIPEKLCPINSRM